MSDHMEAGGLTQGVSVRTAGGADSGFLTTPLPLAGDLDRTLQDAEAGSRCCRLCLAVGSGQGPCQLSGPSQSL